MISALRQIVYLLVIAALLSLGLFLQTAHAACPPTAADPTDTCASADASTGFSRQGIFGCGRNSAALSGSVGAFSATGGVFVPVADYTTELNTGTLVYLECVLRGIVDRESESANSALIQKTVQYVTTGDGGNAMFEVNPRQEKDTEANRVALTKLQEIQGLNDSVTTASGGALVQAVARSHMADRQPLQQLQCPFQGDLRACRAGNDMSDDCKNALTDSRCSDFAAAQFRKQYVSSAIQDALIQRQLDLDRGRGFYSVTTIDANGNRTIQTPGTIVEQTTAQALTSGFRRVESANNVDQMVGALYAGLGQQTIAGAGGLLTGLTSAIGNRPAYLSQLTAESSAGLVNAAANAALQVLAGARQVEIQYNNAVSAIANTLTSTIGQLRSIESQCFNLIAYNTTTLHVCTAQPMNGTCTSVSGSAIRVATSTAFSQPIITAQITPIATQVVQNIQKSQQALTLIDQLIAGVTNTSSRDAQRLAMVQLDQLVSRGQLHVSADVTAVQQQQSAVTDTMTALVDSTKTLWADNTDSNQGWCNVNNQAVIDMWAQRWR